MWATSKHVSAVWKTYRKANLHQSFWPTIIQYTVDKMTNNFIKGLRKSLPLKKTIRQNANINAQHGEGFFLKTKKHVGAPHPPKKKSWCSVYRLFGINYLFYNWQVFYYLNLCKPQFLIFLFVLRETNSYAPDSLCGVPPFWRQLAALRIVHRGMQNWNTNITRLKMNRYS